MTDTAPTDCPIDRAHAVRDALEPTGILIWDGVVTSRGELIHYECIRTGEWLAAHNPIVPASPTPPQTCPRCNDSVVPIEAVRFP